MACNLLKKGAHPRGHKMQVVDKLVLGVLVHACCQCLQIGWGNIFATNVAQRLGQIAAGPPGDGLGSPERL
jgi:hypothetical protein